MKRRPEWKMRRIQRMRTKPQRSIEPMPAQQQRLQNRIYTRRS
jgi:hypothetical protein